MSLSVAEAGPEQAAASAARRWLGRLWRFMLVLVGAFVVLLGVLIAPLPGPMGLPVMVVGLILILRNSYKARRGFIRFTQTYPRYLYPVRRLLRREPEFVQVIWQQMLRMERWVLPRSNRFAVRSRRWIRGRRKPTGASPPAGRSPDQ